jgi:trk system potassium uptake protein
MALSIYFHGSYDTFGESLRHSFFQCVSIVSTTGFATADYVVWPQMAWILLFLFFFSGGMIGSTAGGIKFTRHLVLIKNLRVEIKKQLHPNAIVPIQMNKVIIPDDVIRNFLIVFFAYLVVFCTGSLLMGLFTESAAEAFGATISCLSGVGPAFGRMGPIGSYSELHDIAKWILSIIMVIGRIELFPFILIFTKSFWKL